MAPVDARIRIRYEIAYKLGGMVNHAGSMLSVVMSAIFQLTRIEDLADPLRASRVDMSLLVKVTGTIGPLKIVGWL